MRSIRETGGVDRKRPNLGSVKGINRKLPHVGDGGRGVHRQLPHVGNAGTGVNALGIERRRISIGRRGHGLNYSREHIENWMGALQDRLRRVRIACGEWGRVMSPTVTTHQGVTGVFLDPPYGRAAERDMDLYRKDCGEVAVHAGEWCRTNGDNPDLRIALCGYEGEHHLPGWTEYAWKAPGGYGNQGTGRGAANASRERIWFSPHCLGAGGQLELGIT